MKNTFFASVPIAILLMLVPSSKAVTVHFTASGVQGLGNAELWGASNITSNSTAFELRFDFTTTTDAITQAIPLLEGGGNGIGTKSDLNMNNDWAGEDGGTGLGQEGGTQRYVGTTLFDSGNMAVFTDGNDDDITVNIYDQTLGDFDLNDVLIPEPSTAMLSGLGLLAMVFRRRR